MENRFRLLPVTSTEVQSVKPRAERLYLFYSHPNTAGALHFQYNGNNRIFPLFFLSLRETLHAPL